MNQFKINFDDLEWQNASKGARFKAFQRADRQIRLVEFTRDFVEEEWCFKSHIGFVLEGEIEINFSGKTVNYTAGEGIFIPAGENNKHKARSVTNVVKLFLVEDL